MPKPAPKTQISITLPADILDWLDQQSKEKSTSRSAFVSLSLELMRGGMTGVTATDHARSAVPDMPVAQIDISGILDQLDAIEKKADRNIELSMSARDAAKSAPDFIRAENARHALKLAQMVSDVETKTQDAIAQCIETIDQLKSKLAGFSNAISRSYELILGAMQAVEKHLSGKNR